MVSDADKVKNKNTIPFGLGTIGRDMVYTLVSSYLIFYLTDIRMLPKSVMLSITNILLFARLFDAFNDPVMGIIIDRTHSRFSKFKPWLATGALLTGMMTILLFIDPGLKSNAFVPYFAVVYLLWGISFTTNDIAYWSMLPSLAPTQQGRDKIASFARICANIGTFIVIGGLVPITNFFTNVLGNPALAYSAFAVFSAVMIYISQSITLFGVKENNSYDVKRKTTGLRDMLRNIIKNDQMLSIAGMLALFAIGTSITFGFALYYFKYVFGSEGLFVFFAIVMGGAQIAAMALYPTISSKYSRKKIYTLAVGAMALGYLFLLFSPPVLFPVFIACAISGAGQALIQLLMLVFMVDTVDYGQWKLKERYDSAVFSIQPFTNKLGGAISSWVVGRVVVNIGLTDMQPGNLTRGPLWILKLVMFMIPLLCVLGGYLLHRKTYKIDSVFYEQMKKDLDTREAEE